MPVSPSNLKGWYKLNELNAEDDALDYSGNAKHMTAFNIGPVASVDCPSHIPWQRSRYFNGSAFLRVTSSPVLSLPVSFTCWAKPDDVANGTYVLFCITNQGSVGSDTGLGYVPFSGGKVIVVRTNLHTAGGVGNNITPDGNWHFIAGTIDNDGTRSAVCRVDDAIVGPGSAGNAPSGINYAFIGCRSQASTPINFFSGYLTDVRFYDKVLTTDELGAIKFGDYGTLKKKLLNQGLFAS